MELTGAAAAHDSCTLCACSSDPVHLLYSRLCLCSYESLTYLLIVCQGMVICQGMVSQGRVIDSKSVTHLRYGTVPIWSVTKGTKG